MPPQQSSKILLEDSFGSFQVDRAKIIVESTPTGKQLTRIPGCLSVIDLVNGNNRRYRRSVWEKNLGPDSNLQQSIKRNSAFGLLEHPADGHVDLRSPIAVLVTRAELKEGSGKQVVDGEITVLGTPEGQRLVALIEAGWDPTVSSRGYGSLVKGSDGIDEVQDDYVCEGWDVVLKPSFIEAVCTPLRTKDESISGSRGGQAPATALSESEPPLAPQSTPKSTVTPQTSKSMISDIRARLAALKGIDVSRLNPSTFAQGIQEMTALHQQAAAYLSEDMKRSWDVTQLHEEIKAIEAAWNDAQAKPVKQAAKLHEDKSKLLKVTAAVVNAAGTLKKQLGEKVAQLLNLQKLLEQTINRGKYWKAQAESLKGKLDLSEARLEFSCKGLERIAERYKADLTTVGRKLVEVEFAGKLSEAQLEELKKATKPAHIVAVREQLAPSKPAGDAKTVEPKTDVEPKTEKTAVTETKVEPPKAETKPEETPKVDEAKTAPKSSSPLRESTAPQPKVLTQGLAGPTQISESVAVAQRLSRAATQA